METDTPELNKDMIYIVYGMRYNATPADGGEPTIDLEVIGSFSDMADATFCRDFYSDVDTTFEAVNITSTRSFASFPSFDVMLKITLSHDGKNIDIYSICVPGETEPWLVTTQQRCEALAYPEDRDYVISIIQQWALERHDSHTTVNDYVSPIAKEMIDGG